MQESREFQNYLDVLNGVKRMQAEREAQTAANSKPSAYWAEELNYFDYMFEASPTIIKKLRLHCFHLTGDWAVYYGSNKTARKAELVKKLTKIQELDHKNKALPELLIPEPREMGGYGHNIDGALYNETTIRYYESMIAMEHAGILDDLNRKKGRKLMVEVGSGWGGLAYRMKKAIPDSTLVLIDLPEIFLFSAVYLRSMFPDCKAVMYGEVPMSEINQNWQKYDFIFLPNYALAELQTKGVDLTFNTGSFQEMTTGQVEGYVKKMAELGSRHIYSFNNRDRSPYNLELSSVSEILAKYYNTKEQFPSVVMASAPQSATQKSVRVVKNFIKTCIGRPISAHAQGFVNKGYKHIAGTLKQ